MRQALNDKHSASINAQVSAEGILNLTIDGRLDSNTTGKLWREAMLAVGRTSLNQVIVDASGINYCDGSGIALFVKLREIQEKAGGRFEIRGFASEFQRLLDLFPPSEFKDRKIEEPEPVSLPEEVGQAAVGFWEDIGTHIVFIG